MPNTERYVASTVYGWPRIGRRRELKRATESYWNGSASKDELLNVGAELRRQASTELSKAGIDEVPCNDFSFYDQMADMTMTVGAVPERYRGRDPLDTYFAMARGDATTPPLEMTKWFDTNYHYLVPEIGPETQFSLAHRKAIEETHEARANGVTPRPVIIGPITYLTLSKSTQPGFQPLEKLDELLSVYEQLLGELQAAGAEWVQIDEPALVCSQPAEVLTKAGAAIERLAAINSRPKILIATYFGYTGSAALEVLASSSIEGIGLDFTAQARERNLVDLRAIGGINGKRLIAGVIDGRNIWTANLQREYELLSELQSLCSELVVGSSSSLLHVPIDVDLETDVNPEVRPWLAFAQQKVNEITTLARSLNEGLDEVSDVFANNAQVLEARRNSPLTRRDDVRSRVAGVTDADAKRTSDFASRAERQRAALRLPLLPTTTIGSFPQTSEVRQARAELRKGEIDEQTYASRMRLEIDRVVRLQEDLGLDVLVHGEAERNDMVQYFAEQLDGYTFTQHGWVQSYGSRYVRPPIVAGDLARPKPMTVEWSKYAQSITTRPMKGMLTGPVTMLSWSFVRDDQPLAETGRQMALALRDEVNDLERAGLKVIQVDEPALRELLPLRNEDRAEYLTWAVDAFRITTSGVQDATQIHTHMCYAEFGDVLDAIAALDADVISIEAARSGEILLEELNGYDYRNEIGPGVWDIHSPRVPSTDEIVGLLQRTLAVLRPDQVWVNPDCGLKTRAYPETEASLKAMVAAANQVRATL